MTTLPTATRAPRRPHLHALVHGLERYALVGLLAALALIFAVLPTTADVFATTANLRGVVAGQSVVAIAAIAVLVPLVAGHFDVSVGATLGAASYLAASLAGGHHLPIALAIASAIGLGAAVGLVNGILVGYFAVNSFVVTLGIATLLGGLVSVYSGDETLVDVPHAIGDFGSGTWLGVPRPALLLLAVALLVAYLLKLTLFGRRLTFIGANPNAARLNGIDVRRHTMLAFVASGTLAAVAGALLLARTGAANPGVGQEYTLGALAAAFLGATTIRPGQFNVPGTLVGVFFVAVTVNGLTLAGAADWVEPVFNGAAVVAAVTISSWLSRHRSSAAP